MTATSPFKYRDAKSAFFRFTIIAGVCTLLAACNLSKPSTKAEINTETKFSSLEYGVKGSPRVTVTKKVPKGGGRYQVGKPYKIRGKWYKPVENPDYAANGQASWYGPNFHGRLTANGEIYDQYSLSAAHPTMPLPSYAKVTNLENGRSLIVRVNDRGPFAHGRIIDLSARAAEMLDYKSKGVADVRVEYVGKARMDGRDGRFLMASYRERGKNNISPGMSQPGTLLAMNETSRAESVTGSTSSNAEFAVSAGILPIPIPSPGHIAGGIPMDLAKPETYRVAAFKPLGYAPVVSTHGSRIDAVFAALERSSHQSSTRHESINRETGQSEESIIRVGLFSHARQADNAIAVVQSYGILSCAQLQAMDGTNIWEVRLMVGQDVAGLVLAALRKRGFETAEILH
jgi:rare lipoprotein A